MTPDEQKLLAEALRNHEPWLEWAGKREQYEKGWFEVDPVALHIHERVSAQAIIRAARREDVQRDLFADPQQEYREAMQFYRHSMDWANRLILGDSLQVMSSLARRENTNLDPIFEKHKPVLEARLEACNKALAKVPEELRAKLKRKLAEKQKAEGKHAITDADRRRWLLPPDNRDPKVKLTVDAKFAGWYDWEVPFETDPDWPRELSEAVTAYRQAWRAKMDEVNACIAANADQEELVDQPRRSKSFLVTLRSLFWTKPTPWKACSGWYFLPGIQCFATRYWDRGDQYLVDDG